jgi:hypothetical protein
MSNQNYTPETAVDPNTTVLAIYKDQFELLKEGKIKSLPINAIPLTELGKISHFFIQK